MSDILIESFDVNVGASESTYTLTNDVGSTSSAFVKINNSTDKSSAGPTGSSGNTNANVAHCATTLDTTDSLKFYKNTSTSVKVIGEVWRYVGAISGPNEFINRGTYAITINSGASSASTSVSGIVNRNDCVPFLLGVNTNSASRNDYEQNTFGVYINSSDEVVIVRGNTGSATTATVYVNVVEFTGSNWSVGHGVSSNHYSSTETVTLNTDSSGTGGSTFDVSDWSTAFLEASGGGDSVETGLADVMFLCYPHADTDKVYVSYTDADGAARNDSSAYVHVVKNNNLVVTRYYNSNISTSDGSYLTLSDVITLEAGGSLDTVGLEWFVSTSGTGTAHKRGSLGAKIRDVANNPGVVLQDGDSFDSNLYNSSDFGFWRFDVEFPASPSGVLVEAGGTGTGMFIGFNSSGEFIARGGNGGSVDPTDCARIVVPSSTYDFSGKSGTLVVTISPDDNRTTLTFDENSTGTADYEAEVTAVSSFSNWSGGNEGFVGDSNGNIAGTEITSNYNFNGVINSMEFADMDLSLGGDTPVYGIEYWVHRTGNTVRARYGSIDVTNLISVSASGNIKSRSTGSFFSQPVKIKSGGAFSTKSVKYKIGGVFEETNY